MQRRLKLTVIVQDDRNRTRVRTTTETEPRRISELAARLATEAARNFRGKAEPEQDEQG